MRKLIRRRVLLAGACFIAGASVWGQQNNYSEKPPRAPIEVGLTYAAERAYIAPGNCDCFWFNGGGADAALTFWKGLGIAAAFTGDHASNAQPGVDISKIAYMAGPRYTYTWAGRNGSAGSKSRWQGFGEALFGGVHAFDSSFPTTTTPKSSADAYAMQVGGGINLFISRSFAVRALEADYVRTALPNGYSNVQNDLRLGAGVTYQIGTRRHLP